MSKGKVKVNYVGSAGDVVGQGKPTWNFIYEVSLTKNPRYNIGDRVVLPDGREFRYAKSNAAAALYAAHGCEFTATGYISITAFAAAASVGDTEITIPAATHAALTADELRGGYVIIFDGAGDYYTTVRGIVGNDAADADALFKVYLDGPLTYAITAGTSKAEVYQNPYAALTVASDAAKPKAGVPAAYVSAAANYFWVQTKGITWVAPQGTVNNNEGVGVAWRHDGSIEALATALGGTIPDADTTQIAGHCVEGSQSGNGPLINLT